MLAELRKREGGGKGIPSLELPGQSEAAEGRKSIFISPPGRGAGAGKATSGSVP